MPSRNLLLICDVQKNKEMKPLVMMAGPKYGFKSASTQELCNTIEQNFLGESYI